MHLVIGFFGFGTLNIADGGVMNSDDNYLGYYSGSTGTVTVRGAGSTWNAAQLKIGYIGSGILNIADGGTVNSDYSYIGGWRATGTVAVKGAGSIWNAGSELNIGDSGSGILNITDGGLVNAAGVLIDSSSMLVMDVGYHSLLNIKNGQGTLFNDGIVRFKAGASVAAGVYQPILAGTFSGDGIYQALGGTWNNMNHTFIVDAPQSGSIANPMTVDLNSSRRAALTDPTSGQTLIAASFLTGTGNITFQAHKLSSSEESALTLMLTAGSNLLAGYNFTISGTTISSNNPVYLSLFVGQDYDEDTFELWHYDGAMWEAFLPTDLSYDGQFASFTVTGFSGYAISGSLIPEPATLGLLALSSVGMLLYRQRRA